MGFDAGALLFKIQAVGAALFKSDMRDAKSSIEGVDQASQKAKGSTDGLGKSTDDVADKARKTKAPLDDQAKATKNTGDESESASKKQDKQAASAERQREAAKTLATGLLGVGFAFSAIMGLSVAKFTEFDAQMSSTSAATMATAQEQRGLADAALDAGADTAYSATEAAAAQEELAKAGQSVADITGGSLKGSLALAAAGQLEVARSAEIMATVLTQFRLPAEKAGHVADVLAAGAGKAQGSVDDLSLALSYVGPLAASMGWSLEETAGTIAYFSTQGIAGEKAGTALRGVLAALQSPSEAAKKVMQQYGVTVYDASGNMVSAATVAQQLKEKLSGLTEEERNAAMGRIFGNEALSAATLLYEGGADAVTTWTDNVNDAAYATEQAAMKQDNLAGDIEKLGGAFDTALIKTGSGANTVLREMVQSVTALVDAYGEAPPEVQGTVAVLGTAGGAMAASAGFAVIAAEKMMDLKKAFEDANKSFGRTALLGGAVGLALTVVVGVVAALAQQQADAKAQAEEYATTLEAGTNRVTKSTRDMVKENLAAKESFLWFSSSSVFDQATKLGVGLDTVTNAAMGNVNALKTLRDTMNWGQVGTEEFRSRLEASGLTLDEYYAAVMDVENGVKGTNSSIEEAIRVAEQKAQADGQAKDAAKEHEAALAGLAGKARDTELDVQGLADAIRGFGSGQLDAREAARQFEEALDAASESIKENGTTLDINTEAGRSNEAALDAIAQRALTSAAAIATQTGSQEEATRAVQRGRDELINVLGQFGITGQAAEEYADKLGLIPGNIPTAVTLNTETAQNRLNSYIRDNSGREIPLRITTEGISSIKLPNGMTATSNADGNVYEAYANGGTRYENHVAQMARAGAMRVWSEPETMGESYIPHAEAKRSRSEQLMSETASLFGGAYIPRSQMQGGRSAQTPSISVPITVNGSPGMNVEQLASRVQARVIEVIERKLK